MPPNPSEATKTKPEATEAKYESHREHANASRMDHSDTALTMKPQQVQVHDSNRCSRDSNTLNNTICSNDDTTSDGKRSMHDKSLSTNSLYSDTGSCYHTFDPGGNRPNDKHRGTATHEDGDSTSDNINTRLCSDSDLTGSGMLSCSIWDCNDDTCCSSPLSVCATHGLDNSNRNLAFNPGGSPLSNSSVESKCNAISNTDASSLGSNTLMYDRSGFSDNSNSSWLMCNPGGTHFSNTLDHTDATTTSDHSDHIFDPSSVHSHSGLPSSRVPQSIINHNLVFDPGGDPVNSYIDSIPFSPDLYFIVAFPPCMIHGIKQAPPSECAPAAFMLSDIASPLSADDPSSIQLPWLTMSELDPGGSRFECLNP
jgi:hypothetical protein